MLRFRRAEPQDFESILRLQHQNLFSTLSETERVNGFLSTAYTFEDFQRMHQSMGIIICEHQGALAGYLCASYPEAIRRLPHPFPSAMMDFCQRLSYKQRPLSDYRFFIGNPACIAAPYRGYGVLARLVEAVCELPSSDTEVGVTFVAINNQRSLQACQKLNLNALGTFEILGHSFTVLLKDLNSRTLSSTASFNT